MKLERLKLPVALLLSLSATAEAAPLNNSQLENAWYKDAQARLNQRLEAAQKSPNAKNVILFVGDGMGVSTLTAARILEGQKAGKSGEEGYLSFESFPYTALVKTYNVDA
ncbi:alkaline phosphatase, partial [Thalassolituus sp. UBA2009]